MIKLLLCERTYVNPKVKLLLMAYSVLCKMHGYPKASFHSKQTKGCEVYIEPIVLF